MSKQLTLEECFLGAQRSASPEEARVWFDRFLYADFKPGCGFTITRWLDRLCGRLLGDRIQVYAEDVTQEVLVGLYLTVLTGPPVQYPRAWCGTVARRTCWRLNADSRRLLYIDYLEEMGGEELVTSTATPNESFEDRVALVVADFLLQASPLQQKIVEMLYRGCDKASIARELGTTRQSVWNAVQRIASARGAGTLHERLVAEGILSGEV